jgi:putative toxin-antitoxin system antitoxin component (TIGR02293 family)
MTRRQRQAEAARGSESAKNVGHGLDWSRVGDQELLAERAKGRLKTVGSVDHFIDEELRKVSDLFGGRQVLGAEVESEMDAHALLNRGLPRGALNSLIEKLHDTPVVEVSEALGMSVRTLQRHKAAPIERLDVQQSGRAWKFAQILAKATRVLGSQDEAEQWLKRPAIGLNQERPLDLLTTPAGVKLVEDYLGRIEYSVYT